MRQLSLGVVGVLWGGGLVISGFVGGISDGASGAGQGGAFAFGIVLLVVGVQAIVKHRRFSSAAFQPPPAGRAAAPRRGGRGPRARRSALEA